ncbi:MAG: D-threo-aldose 1-dehydrogenase [Granulosicoccus sp.]|jgi:D-threo-aldose 1-dehydrogenase
MKYRAVGQTALPVSELGLGCASLAGVGTSVTDDDAVTTLRGAIDAGIGYYDTAPFFAYGRSERLLGDALRHAGKPVQLSSKVGRLFKSSADSLPSSHEWPDGLPMRSHFDYSYDGIMRSFEDSLQRICLASIDILFLRDNGELTHGVNGHQAMMKEATTGGYRVLSEIRSQGLIKTIGLGVNECDVCLEAINFGDCDCFLLAGRFILLEQSALDELFPTCRKYGTSTVIGGPFNSGILVGGSTYNHEAAPAGIMERVEAIVTICDSHYVALPAPALQFVLAHPLVSSVIPGPRTASELVDTLSWYETEVPDSLWSNLKTAGLLEEVAVV